MTRPFAPRGSFAFRQLIALSPSRSRLRKSTGRPDLSEGIAFRSIFAHGQETGTGKADDLDHLQGCIQADVAWHRRAPVEGGRNP
jgi:hypothetical protein